MRTIVVLTLLGAAFSVQAVERQRASVSSPHIEKGTASFYGRNMDGHKTACGGTYVASEMTAAHRTLPCGTKIRITNTKNDRSVEVTVNDHGPTSRKRIVDVSLAAAEKLGFVKQGTTTVAVQIVK
jgi:rare lipoprotein A